MMLAAGCHSYKDEALAAVRQDPKRSDIAGCVTEAMSRNPSQRGSLELALEIAPTGKVNRLVFSQDNIKDEQLKECVKQKAANWDMPPHTNEKMEQFFYKFQVRN